MKKSLLTILIIGTIALIAIGILLWHQKSQLITGFLGLGYDPLDINQDKQINQSDLEQYAEFYQQNNPEADFNMNGQVDYDDLVEYTLLFRNR